MKKGYLKSAIVFIIVVSGFGCGNVTGPTNPTPTVQSVYVGQWTGTTSEGFPVSFTVSGNAITYLEIDMLKSVGGAPAERSTLFSQEPATISGDGFKIDVFLTPKTENLIVIGTPVSCSFASTAAAEGTAGSNLGISWKAERK